MIPVEISAGIAPAASLSKTSVGKIDKKRLQERGA
jgi:hypothetical protein